MTAFREGDLVRCLGHATDEWHVIGPGGAWGPESCLQIRRVVDGQPLDVPPRLLTLLRRPVRVGDVLRWKRGGLMAETHPDSRLEAYQFDADRDLSVLYEHEDGTPIDPPAAPSAEPAKPALDPLPNPIEELARALWREDRDILAFIARVADCQVVGDIQIDRFDHAANIAWERDELGARTRYTAVATRVLARLKGE